MILMLFCVQLFLKADQWAESCFYMQTNWTFLCVLFTALTISCGSQRDKTLMSLQINWKHLASHHLQVTLRLAWTQPFAKGIVIFFTFSPFLLENINCPSFPSLPHCWSECCEIKTSVWAKQTVSATGSVRHPSPGPHYNRVARSYMIGLFLKCCCGLTFLSTDLVELFCTWTTLIYK